MWFDRDSLSNHLCRTTTIFTGIALKMVWFDRVDIGGGDLGASVVVGREAIPLKKVVV